MKKWLPYLIVGTLLVGGLVISAFYAPIWYDDAGHFLVARAIARGDGMCYPLDAGGMHCIPHSPFITMGPVQAYPLGAWLSIWGETMLAGRLLMVLLSLATAFALFRLGKILTSSTKALIAVGIIALNIQFITYGAEVLGEVPMMGLILAGMSYFLRWERRGKWWNALLGIVLWCLAVGIKEYAILPTALSLVFWLLVRLISKNKPIPVLFLAATYALALALTLALLHGADLLGYLRARQSYGSEFLAFNVLNSLKFLLLKPLFWLGTGAMVLKWRVKRRPDEALTLSVQLAWTVFFLLSAGYDRFGFLLLFLPAIYVAEFLPYLWQEAGRRRGRWLRRSLLVGVSLLVFAQQTYWVFGQRILHPETVNAIEQAATDRIAEKHYGPIMTVEQQMAVFLDRIGHPWRLVSIVPSAGHARTAPLPEFKLSEGEVLLAGPYAITEYYSCFDWQQLVAIDTVTVGAEQWTFYINR